MNINYVKLNPSAKSPQKSGHDQDPQLTAGINLFSTVRVRINTHSHAHVPTGISVEIPRGYFGLLKARSGFASETGAIINAGVIDANYRGEIIIIVNNPTGRIIDIEVGESIAQMILLRIPEITLVETNKLSETERGTQGFNSTD